MIFVQHTPAAPLNRCIRALWYSRNADPTHRLERMLPSGCVQVILNLARDFLLDYHEDGPASLSAPTLVVGARSVYEIVDTSDMTDLIGIVFRPGGFAPFASDSVDLFSNRFVSLQDIWGSSVLVLRDRLRDVPTPVGRLRCLEDYLSRTFAARLDQNPSPRLSMVQYALSRFESAPRVSSVREVARSTGWSERRFSQVFREQVGFSPKAWTRIQRFQRAVAQLHAGVDLRWAELALECGYYDQSHFANEFRAFSGIDVTTYTARHTQWANHVSAD
jgi:AraC-like DNA-binding protein